MNQARGARTFTDEEQAAAGPPPGLVSIEPPEDDTVKVRFSTRLLTQLSNSEGPLRLESLGEPDADGFYCPTFSIDLKRCPLCGGG